MKKWLLVAVVAALPIAMVLVSSHLAMARYVDVHRVRIATGGPGGTYHKMGNGFSRLLDEDPRLRIALDERGYDAAGAVDGTPSEGALENLDLLARGETDVAFVQGGLPRQAGIVFIMNLYRASVQVVARRGLRNRAGQLVAEIEDLDDWDEGGPTARISIGSPRSGTRFLALKILKFYQKEVVLRRSADPLAIEYWPHIRTLGFQESLLALRRDPSDPKAIDVAFFVSGTGTVDAIKKLLYVTDARGDLVDREGRPIEIDPSVRLEEHERIVPDVAPEANEGDAARPRYRFLSIGRNEGLSIAYPYLTAFAIPQGTYSSRLRFPDEDIPTVSVYEMLCASERADLDWFVSNRLTEAIWKKKALLEDVPQLARTTAEEARQTTEYEPDPGAVDFFNHKERLPWALILASASAGVSIFGSMTKVRMWIFRWRMLREMAWVFSIEDRIPGAAETDLVAWLERLETIHHTLTMDFCKIRIGVSTGIGLVLDRVRLVRDKARNRLAELRAA